MKICIGFFQEENIHEAQDRGRSGTLLSEGGRKILQLKAFSNCDCVCYFLFLIVFTVMCVMGRGSGSLNFTQTEGTVNAMLRRRNWCMGVNGVV